MRKEETDSHFINSVNTFPNIYSKEADNIHCQQTCKKQEMLKNEKEKLSEQRNVKMEQQ